MIYPSEDDFYLLLFLSLSVAVEQSLNLDSDTSRINVTYTGEKIAEFCCWQVCSDIVTLHPHMHCLRAAHCTS